MAELTGPPDALGVALGFTEGGAVCVQLATPAAVFQLAPAVAGALGQTLIGLAQVAAQLGPAPHAAN